MNDPGERPMTRNAILVAPWIFALGCGALTSLDPKDPKALVGTWNSPCFLSTSSRDAVWTDTYTDTTRTRVFQYYDPSDGCTTRQTYHDTRVNQYVLGAASGSATKYDVTQISNTRTYSSQSRVDAANAAAHFGYTNWVVDQPKDISGRAFSATDTVPAQVNGTRYYGIYALAHSSGTWSLQYGDDSGVDDGSSDALRPTSLTGKDWIKD
jgi:hypothetical protein